MVEKAVTSGTDSPVVLPGPRIEPSAESTHTESTHTESTHAEPAPVEAARADDPDLRPDPFDPRIAHRVHLVERHAFTVAVCEGCGWESFARRSRPLARSEGRDHVLLYGS
jgi:hypothetical protein